MREERYPQNQNISQERSVTERQFSEARREWEPSFANDYLALGETYSLDRAQLNQLEPSWCTQLDIVGMQPHSREYLEHEVNCMRTARKFSVISGQVIDHTPGIQFGGTP